jgi:hypothetical protein
MIKKIGKKKSFFLKHYNPRNCKGENFQNLSFDIILKSIHKKLIITIKMGEKISYIIFIKNKFSI